MTTPDLFPAQRRPRTAAQRAMAAKPTLREIERAHAVQLNAWAHQDAKRLGEPCLYKGWTIWRYESWKIAGWIYIAAEAPPLPNGRPGQHDSEDFATENEARAWVAALPDRRVAA